MGTKIIVFSKNRTLQLKSLLLSLRDFSDVSEEDISVLFVDSEGIDYGVLEKDFKCEFVKQKNFLGDVKRLVSENDAEYILFMVDDLIFRNEFSIKEIERFLGMHPEIEAFSFRLGENIEGPLPQFMQHSEGVLVWETETSLGKHWNYFWELSGTMYRKKHVMEYLHKCRPDRENFPNALEYHYYACMPTVRTEGIKGMINNLRFFFRKKSHVMASFFRSKCFTQGVNLVADINDERKETFSPLELHRKMLDGYIIDYKSLKDTDVHTPNPGHEHFKLIKESEIDRD